MMTNLFTPFDPSSHLNLKLNWISLFLFMMMMKKSMFTFNSRWKSMENMIEKKMILELKSLNPNKQSMTVTITTFSMILLFNMQSLFPYTFTPTSNILISLSMALPIWMMSIMYMIKNKPNKFFSHLLPKGTPLILKPFMILIETMGVIIRPISLSVRLMANLTAGHLIMSMISSKMELMMSIILFIQSLFLAFEMSISVIQAYVFSTLASLYSK